MQDADRAEVAKFIERHWHDKKVMSQGHAYYPHELDGFLQRRNGDIIGLLTYRIDGEAMEVLTLNATITKPKNPSGLRVASWTTRSTGQGRGVRTRRFGRASGWAMLKDMTVQL